MFPLFARETPPSVKEPRQSRLPDPSSRFGGAATLYVTRYNRALLRRTIKDVQRTQSRAPSLRLEPMIGLTSGGLRLRF
jgi:hypothetical protein